MSNHIALSDHFTYRRLLQFTAPTMGTMVFLSIYSMVDGFFVSNFVGKTAFAGINLLYPFIMILGVFGTMIGTGGSALVGKHLGEKQKERANSVFSMLTYFNIFCSTILAIIGFIMMPFLANLLGATGELFSKAVLYGRIVSLGIPLVALQSAFQSFFVTAERPNLGLLVIASAGMTNLLLDALFIIVFKWGVAGAAIATVIGQIVGGVIPTIYFLAENTSQLQLKFSSFDLKTIGRALTNGLSEFVSSSSSAVVGLLYNYQLIKYLGENGVAAYGVIMYISFIFVAFIIGYCMGTAPLISYNYGAHNKKELSNIFSKNIVILAIMGVLMTIVAGIFAPQLSHIFVGYDKELMSLTISGLSLYKWAFLIMGINIFGSAFFTALNNGLISATISFVRTFIFECSSILFLPMIIGVLGIWISMPVAESLTLAMVIFFFVYLQKYYGYTLQRLNAN